MSRFTLKAEAQDHVQAYLEYRMIVGDRDGGKLLNESEYEKLREDFYAKRRAGGFTQITYTNSFKSKGQLEGGEGSRLSSRLPSSNTSSGLKRMVTPTSATRGGSNRSNSLQGGVVIEEDDNNNNSDEEVPMFSRGGTYTRSTTSSSSSARKSSGTSSTKSNSQTSSSPYDLIKRRYNFGGCTRSWHPQSSQIEDVTSDAYQQQQIRRQTHKPPSIMSASRTKFAALPSEPLPTSSGTTGANTSRRNSNSNNNNNYGSDDGKDNYTKDDPISQLERQLQDANLSEAKRYGLKKQLNMEKAKQIRARRKEEQEARRLM